MKTNKLYLLLLKINTLNTELEQFLKEKDESKQTEDAKAIQQSLSNRY